MKAKFGFDSVSKMGLNMVGAAVVVPDASDGTEPENPYDGNFLDKHKKQESLERWKCKTKICIMVKMFKYNFVLFSDAGDNVALNPAFMD